MSVPATWDKPPKKRIEAELSSLGAACYLYSLSDIHRNWSIGSLHQWIAPAITANQYLVYRRRSKPVGYVSWAWLSREFEGEYLAATRTLTPDRWKSGDRLWFIDFIAPFGDTRMIAGDLRKRVFPNRTGKFLREKVDDDVMRIFHVHGAAVRRDSLQDRVSSTSDQA